MVGVLWKSYFGLLKGNFGERAVEKLLWATQGPLWGACCGGATLVWATQGCGRATLGYSGPALASVLVKLPGVLKSQVLTIQQPHSPTGGELSVLVLIQTK